MDIGLGQGTFTFWLGGESFTPAVERPDVVTIEGARPVQDMVMMDPILLSRAGAAPLRELVDAAERYEKRIRE